LITVDLVDHMGNDLRVANAARVSFSKESKWDLVPSGEESGIPFVTLCNTKLSERDTKLIYYLARHGHWSPFSHCFLTFRIKAPLFVARQLAKHQVGLAWNEVSRRYVDSDPEFYKPDGWRKRAENVKQGSGDILRDKEHLNAAYAAFVGRALGTYQGLLDQGVAPEMARMVLPQSMMTEWYWSGSLYAFARVVRQRLDPHAQRETQDVAELIDTECGKAFPISWKALMEKRHDRP